MSEQPIVFIIDDDADTCMSIAALVQSMGVGCECYESAEQFLAVYLPNRSGCVVTDLRMKGMSGLDLLENLLEAGINLPVVVITAYASIPLAVQARQSGATTFLEKSCTEHELWEAIKNALNKDLTRRKREQTNDVMRAALSTLTDEERRVLELITNGMLNKQVALKLRVSTRTVEDRRRRIIKKLGVESFAELVRFVVKTEEAVASKSE